MKVNGFKDDVLSGFSIDLVCLSVFVSFGNKFSQLDVLYNLQITSYDMSMRLITIFRHLTLATACT